MNLKNSLVQVEAVFDLLFMRDVSHLLTYCSKESQRFDVLPFDPMNVANKVLANLIASGDSFIGGKIPDSIPLHEKKTYEVWGKCKCPVNKILETKKLRVRNYRCHLKEIELLVVVPE